MPPRSPWIAVILVAAAWLVLADADRSRGAWRVDLAVAESDDGAADCDGWPVDSCYDPVCSEGAAGWLFSLQDVHAPRSLAFGGRLSAGVILPPDHPPRFSR